MNKKLITIETDYEIIEETPQLLKASVEYNREKERVEFDSRYLANLTHKRHDNILRMIRSHMDNGTDEFGALNFEESSYINTQNKKQPYIRMTSEGFFVIAMSFTGKGGALLRERMATQVKALYDFHGNAANSYRVFDSDTDIMVDNFWLQAAPDHPKHKTAKACRGHFQFANALKSPEEAASIWNYMAVPGTQIPLLLEDKTAKTVKLERDWLGENLFFDPQGGYVSVSEIMEFAPMMMAEDIDIIEAEKQSQQAIENLLQAAGCEEVGLRWPEISYIDPEGLDEETLEEYIADYGEPEPHYQYVGLNF